VSVALLAAACGGDEARDGGDATGAGGGEADLAATGKELYDQTCAACHGTDLQGTQSGPPFLHEIYAPNHHPDQSFYSAVAGGVEPHHWDFGAMPPQPSVSQDEVRAIIAYVRDRQRAEGIVEDPSH
jgi:mono/diheme cytochrome c family protein